MDAAVHMSVKGSLSREMAAVGHPPMDLGSAMAYWIDRDDPEENQLLATQPPAAPGMLSRSRMIGRYAGAIGRKVENFDFYYTFGLFRRVVNQAAPACSRFNFRATASK